MSSLKKKDAFLALENKLFIACTYHMYLCIISDVPWSFGSGGRTIQIQDPPAPVLYDWEPGKPAPEAGLYAGRGWVDQ